MADMDALDVDVTGGTLAAHVAVPEGFDGGTLLFCIPGMTYTGQYYDLPFEDGYSFADHMLAAGYAVAYVDNLGTGASSRPDPASNLDLEGIAAANHDASVAMRERVGASRVIGVGHSMGGGCLVVQQANHRSFDAIAVLGATTQKLAGIYVDHENEDALTFAERAAWAKEHIPPAIWGAPFEALDPYFLLDRSGFHGLFHYEDVPAEIIAADDKLTATVAPKQAALDIITPYLVSGFAEKIAEPVFLCFGEIDLSPDPQAEIAAYTSSDDVTLFVLDRSAHCHNLASTRARLWNRLDDWVRGLA